MKNKRIEKLIYKNLDGTLSNKELEILKHEWDISEPVREEYQQILELRDKINESGIRKFKPLFEERLLDKLSSGKQLKTVSTGWIGSLGVSFRQITLTAAIILALLITYNMKNGNYYSIQNLFGDSNNNLEIAFDPVQNLLGRIE
jgi:hypothetical protein